MAKLLHEADYDTTIIEGLEADLVNEITLDGVVKGTPGYMAPEQVDPSIANKDQQTDIFSLGAILYTILTLKGNRLRGF